MGGSVTFDRVRHFCRLPVEVGGVPEQFLLDTGIGITVVSPEVGSRSGVEPTGTTYAGRRMSGQLVEAPLVRLPELRIGDVVVGNHVAGVIDLGGGSDFAGILSPAFFEARPLTVDPGRQTLTIGEPGGPVPEGTVVDLYVHRDGPAVDWSADLALPSGRIVRVEVDTGSGSLILDTQYLADFGLGIDDPVLEVTTRPGTSGRGAGRRSEDPCTSSAPPRPSSRDLA